MKRRPLGSSTREAIPFRESMRIKLTDHLLIRICAAAESRRKDRLHGLIRPPPVGKPYGPTILVVWAKKVIERRCVKPFQLGGYTCHKPLDRLFSYGMRFLDNFGSLIVPLSCSIIGFVIGLIILNYRVFRDAHTSLPQILFPVASAATFIGSILISLMWFSVKIIRGSTDADDYTITDDDLSQQIRGIIRGIIPGYIMWNLKLAGLALWVAISGSMSYEYFAHRPEEREYDYVYAPRLKLDNRLTWIRKLSFFIPSIYHLEDIDIAYADSSYRWTDILGSETGGYVFTDTEPSNLTVAASMFERRNKEVYLKYDPDLKPNNFGAILLKDKVLKHITDPYEIKIKAEKLYLNPPQIVEILGSGATEHFDIKPVDSQPAIRLVNLPESQEIILKIDEIYAAPEHIIILSKDLPRKIELHVGTVKDHPLAALFFDRVEPGYEIIMITKPDDYELTWFLFQFYVVLIFGMAPALISLVISAPLCIVGKRRLYRELAMEPFASIIAEANQLPTSSIVVEDRLYHAGLLGNVASTRNRVILPHRDVLAVGYNTRITDEDVRKIGRVADFLRFERPAGDAETNVEVMKWLNDHESFGRLIFCLKLTSNPDRPLIKLLQDIMARRFNCELAFLDMPKKRDPSDSKYASRAEVWQETMKIAGLIDILPLTLQGAETRETSNE